MNNPAKQFIEDHLTIRGTLPENLQTLKAVLTLFSKFIPESYWVENSVRTNGEKLIRAIKNELGNSKLTVLLEREILKFEK